MAWTVVIAVFSYNLFAMLDMKAQKSVFRPLSRPMGAILDFWGSHKRENQIKKLIQQKLIGGSKNLEKNIENRKPTYF